MQSSKRMCTAAALVAGMFVAVAMTRAEVPEQDVKKIQEAAPAKAVAKPAKPRKVLVYSHCNGFFHRSIDWANVAVKVMGEKTGAYTTVISNDLSNFEPDKLKQFDLVVLNNTTGELFTLKGPRKPRKPNPKRIKDPAKLKAAQAKYEKDLVRYEEALKAFEKEDKPDTAGLRKSFMSWIKNGGAVCGVHAATDCSYGWKEYGEMIGGWFSGHPWHELVTVRNDDPTNPINAAFWGKGFKITDEIYMFKRGMYSREKQRVLLSLDPAYPKTAKGKRDDKDYGISWVKIWGKGRVFYCSLGHRNEIFWNPAVLKHYLAGMQWAMGDLDGVETKPNPLGK